MKAIFFKFYVFVFSILVSSFVFSQEYPGGVSSGKLNINGKTKEVKIFSSTDPTEFSIFPMNDYPNALVIINATNTEVKNNRDANYIKSIISQYETGGFTFLNKKFQPAAETVNASNIGNYKYLLKTDEKLANNDQISLDTSFKIWDPSSGFKIGKFTLHFYSLMFVFAFGFGYLLMTKIFKIDNVNQKYLEPLFTWTLIGTIFGARIGHVIFYEPELIKKDFWAVFLPIRTVPEFEFTGFSGLASHGATIALILTTLYYSYKIIKKNPFWVYDRLGIVVALGGAFVRIGNFFNSEIIGKPINPDSPLAILFPQQSKEYGLTVPRYPTQLLEAGGYFLLFILLWILYRKTNKKYQLGWLFGLFFIILWAIRFFVEYLKEPQGDEFIQFAGLNTGQVLSIPFIIAGIVIMWYSKRNTITEEQNEKPD